MWRRIHKELEKDNHSAKRICLHLHCVLTACELMSTLILLIMHFVMSRKQTISFVLEIRLQT